MLRKFVDSDVRELQRRAEYCGMSAERLQKLIDEWKTNEYKCSYFEMFAVTENAAIVGQASLYGRSEHIVSCGLELYDEYRGKGYGASAYGELLSIAENKGFTIAVAQVGADNAASIALHRKMGFEAEDYAYINKKGDPIYYFIKRL